ncbi:hypothetical protein MPSEU_000046600 [Mayamaea pseudoterrestris]|nr:hypothetical protein MPSEU_000046600 [Mayamaea pseudoterrestris]
MSSSNSKGLSRRSAASSQAASASKRSSLSDNISYNNNHQNSNTLCCLNCYNYRSEVLEYDYSRVNDATSSSQPFPRIRSRGEYYIDSYNDQPWSWTFGTHESNGIWCNSSDQAGSIMSAMVWLLMMYSAMTVTSLTVTEGIPVPLGLMYNCLVTMSLACHAKTSLTDPGSVPHQAIPSERQRMARDSHSMCGQCQTFKPPGSHHCRICNRCIGRMDHHCPWMNNCVGVANLKHFLLFLSYTWTCATYSLVLFGWNYFFCADEDCTFHPLVVHLVRIMTLLALGAFLFTSSMLMNVLYGVLTGIGTIDRLKKKATNTMSQSEEEPIQLIDIFGIAPIYTWFLPIDPIFEDFDRVMGYTMPQRLDRERQFCEGQRSMPPDLDHSPSLDHMPKCVNDLLPV